jgi:hypothetical protein
MIRAAAVFVAALLTGCSAADQLDCSGIGTVHGQYADANLGRAELRYGAVWGSAEAGHSVVLSGHQGYAEALQRSARPLVDSALAAELLGIVVIGANYDTSGDFVDYFTYGKGRSSGSGGGYSGSLRVNAEGCARGNVALYRDNAAVFALPRWRPENARLYTQGPEGGGATATVEWGVAPPDSDDPLQWWATLHAQLMRPDPGEALQALGLSPPAAAHLASDPVALATLERLRTQCPDPSRSRLNEYGEVEGPSTAAAGITLFGRVTTDLGEGGLTVRHCSVSRRNGEAVEQCWPLNADCREAPLWKPGG